MSYELDQLMAYYGVSDPSVAAPQINAQNYATQMPAYNAYMNQYQNQVSSTPMYGPGWQGPTLGPYGYGSYQPLQGGNGQPPAPQTPPPLPPQGNSGAQQAAGNGGLPPGYDHDHTGSNNGSWLGGGQLGGGQQAGSPQPDHTGGGGIDTEGEGTPWYENVINWIHDHAPGVGTALGTVAAGPIGGIVGNLVGQMFQGEQDMGQMPPAPGSVEVNPQPVDDGGPIDYMPATPGGVEITIPEPVPIEPTDMTLGDLLASPVSGGTSPISLPAAPVGPGFSWGHGTDLTPGPSVWAGHLVGGNYGGGGQWAADANHYEDVMSPDYWTENYAEGGSVDADPMDLDAMLMRYFGPSTSGADLDQARAAVTTETEAFNKMIEAQMAGNPADKSEMYFRLAAAFGSPTKSGTIGETLGNAANAMADTRKSESARRAERADLGLRAQQMRLSGAKESLATAQALAQDDNRARREIAVQLLKDRLKSDNDVTPYYTPVPSAGGLYAFNNRTGSVGLVPGAGGAPILTPPTDPELRRRMEQQGAEGGVIGKATAEAQLALPQTIANAEKATNTIKQLINAPGFTTLYGKSGIGGVAAAIPSSEAADANALLEQVRGESFLTAYESLRGSGAITDKEGEAATLAMSRLFDRKQSDESAMKAAVDLLQIVSGALERAKAKAGVAPSGGNDASAEVAAPVAKRKRFNPASGAIEEY